MELRGVIKIAQRDIEAFRDLNHLLFSIRVLVIELQDRYWWKSLRRDIGRFNIPRKRHIFCNEATSPGCESVRFPHFALLRLFEERTNHEMKNFASSLEPVFQVL